MYYDALAFASMGGANRQYLYDGLGSTRQLLDGNEDVTDSYAYEAFGNVLSDGGPTPNPYRYVGSLGYYQIYPPEAGGPTLMHLGARYYMPEMGRFLQRDPVQADPSLYGYVRNNPSDYVDPNGQIAWWWICAIPCGAHVGALAAAALGCIGAPDWDACMHEVLSDPKIKCWYRDIAGGACLACLSAGLFRGGRPEPLPPEAKPCYRLARAADGNGVCYYRCPSSGAFVARTGHLPGSRCDETIPDPYY